MRGINESLIGLVDVEDDAAGEDGVDHTGQPATGEWETLKYMGLKEDLQ